MADKNIKGITIEIGGESTKLQDALKKPEAQAKSLTGELRQIDNALKFNPESVDLLNQRTTVLAGQVAAATDKLLTLKNATAEVQRQAAAGEIGEEQQRAFQRELIETQSQLNHYQRELSETQSKMSVLNGDFKSAAASAEIFEKELADGNAKLKETKPSADKANEGLTTLKVAFGNLVADGIRLAISAMKDFIVQGIEYNSSLLEVSNVIETVFGPDGAAQIEAWADTSLKSFGMSELTAKQYASTLGTIIDAMGVTGQKNIEMSTSLTQITADWASFRDMKPEEVYKKIQSAITGETEAIKGLGIVMTVSNLQRYAASQGIKKNYNDMTEAEKVTLRYNYIMEKSDEVLGDFAKTSDSLHNQQTTLTAQTEELAGAFAEHFTPTLTEALQSINKYITENADTLSGLGTVVATIINALVMLLSILSVFPPELYMIIGMVLLAIKAYTEMKKALTPTTDALKKMKISLEQWEGSADGFIVKILAIIAALAVLLFLILAIKEGTDKAANAIKEAGNIQPPSIPNIPAHAKGTRNAPRGVALVGEEGPELVRFRGGETVLPARQTARALSSTGTTSNSTQVSYNTIYVQGLTELQELLDFQDNERRRRRAYNGNG